MVKIYFDAGHGYFTSGKRSPNGEREWAFNNTVAVAFENELKNYEGVTLVRTDDRTGKTDVPLATRTNLANKGKADYYISFHHNAKGGTWVNNVTGVETYVYLGNQPKSMALAKALHPAIVKGYGLKDRGIKQADLHIVRETDMPAVLIEGGFMDSIIDIKVLRDTKKLKNIGVLIAQALVKFLNLKRKPTNVAVNIGNEVKNMKLCDLLSTYQLQELKNVYEKAYKNGVFSTKWHDKVTDKSITVGDAIFLNAVLVEKKKK